MHIPRSVLIILITVSLIGNVALGWMVFGGSLQQSKANKNANSTLVSLPEKKVTAQPLKDDAEFSSTMELGSFRLVLGDGVRKSRKESGAQVRQENPLMTYGASTSMVRTGIIATYRLQEPHSGAEQLAAVFVKQTADESLQAWFERVKPAYAEAWGSAVGARSVRTVNGRKWLELSDGAVATQEGDYILVVYLQTYPISSGNLDEGMRDQILASLEVIK